MVREGYLLFMGQAPEIGLKYQPSMTPSFPVARDADCFAAAYGVFDSRQEAEAEAREDWLARQEAVRSGELSDAGVQDIVMRVRIHENGRLDILTVDADALSPGDEGIMFSADAASIYRSFGMVLPSEERSLEMAM